MVQNRVSRYSRAYLSEFTINQLHLRNPYIVMLWSFLAPGLGNLLNNRILKGLILVLWGLLINSAAKINLAIGYSLTGDFQSAIQIIDTRWFLLYIAVHIYATWDSYRGTVDMNKRYILAEREDASITPFIMKTWDINYLDKRNPWLAAVWSALMPGLGNLYLHKIITGLFFIAWSIVVIYFSHALQAVHLTMIGEFHQAKAMIDMQWFLYIPGIYGFQIYCSYVSAVEYNKLFEKEQSKWLRDHYQKNKFKMPI
jgi:TM2 domain-containing membrane protein YozV